MTDTKTVATRSLTVLVEEETAKPPAQHDLLPGQVEEHGWFREKVLRHKPLDLGDVQSQLDGIQGEVDDLLGKLATQAKHGFGLSQVQVAVGISAQGSIGVVTAGVQASLTLVYSRPGS
jgi:hypothetical protein